MHLTEEQEKICASRGRTLVVKAYAGCGKTSTLVEYARRRPQQRFLYLAFNRAIKEDAQKKFGRNVRCVTTHGLAYGAFGKQFQHKLETPKPYHLARRYNWSMELAGRVLEVLGAFMCSPDREVGIAHAADAGVALERRSQVVNAASAVWQAMIDPEDVSVPIPHDGYLKLFQLSAPQIPGIDYILFDEAQDSNPLTLDIVVNQPCGKVIVGDEYQSIYGFRKAVNAMNEIPADDTLRLTTSFRFGAGIADLASAILADWRNEPVPLRGKGKHATEWSFDPEGGHAVIARTNAGLFDAAVGALTHKAGFALNGGVNNYKFDLILDAFHLFAKTPGLIRDRFIQSFSTWKSMVEYAGQLDDRELKALVRVVESYGPQIPDLVARIKAEARVDASAPGLLVLTTVHKAKGLEFECVRLVDDFSELREQRDEKTGKMAGPNPEEVHLLYVAITRALRAIEVNQTIVEWLQERSRKDLLKPILEARMQAAQRAVQEEKQAAGPVAPPDAAWLRDMAFRIRHNETIDEDDRKKLDVLLRTMAK